MKDQRAKYESRKAFAGEKKPSMQRRCLDNDYTARRMYMITMVTEGRKPLFGTVVGRSETVKPSPEAPHIEFSPLGEAVAEIWHSIGSHHPEVKVVALQMMPDHLHAILFVKERLKKPLGKVLLGVKQACNKAFRDLMPVEFVVMAQQHAEQSRDNGLLFAKGFNDQILLRDGQLERWLNYLKDNPRRLLMKRENPSLFRVQRGLTFAGHSFSAIGNRFLLERPVKKQVQCSRSIHESVLQARMNECLRAARQGAVLVSPAISKGEKAIMRAAFEEGLPLIYLQENGFTDLAKPGGMRMDACARGQLLILAPWEHHNEKILIKRGQCLELNEIARAICED
jgi:REP element-mobilizing transposase RayT